MKKTNKVLIVSLVLLLLLAASVTAFAFTKSTPAEIVAGLTGKSIEEVTEIRYETGKTFGQIAYDEDLLEEFKDEMLKNKKAILDEKVKEGILTQEEADEIFKNIETMQESCTGNGGGFGMMRNAGNGNGFGMMRNSGNGNGFGMKNAGRGCGLGIWNKSF